jgi:hypothetical protein
MKVRPAEIIAVARKNRAWMDHGRELGLISERHSVDVKNYRYLLVVHTIFARSTNISKSIQKDFDSINNAHWVFNVSRDIFHSNTLTIMILGLMYDSCPD